MATISIENVRKNFGAVEVIKGVSFEVADGQFSVLVGPSGCGKSTLLRMIAGLECVTEGDIKIDGKRINDVPPHQRGIAMVFQSYALYPHMTVAENIGFSLDLKKVPKAKIRRQVGQVAELLQLSELLDRRPSALSGGQRQRVAIGRAIIKQPRVILFDEPLSNLDASLRVQMRAELQRLHQELRSTIVYVTHDQVEAMTMADKIVVLDKGTVAQVGSPLELYNKPNGLFVARFIGSPTMNLVTGPSAAKRGAATIGIRPEHLGLSVTEGEWPARVRIAEHLGSDTFVYAEVEGQGQMTVRVEGDASRKPGDLIYLIPQEDRIHKFDIDGKRIA